MQEFSSDYTFCDIEIKNCTNVVIKSSSGNEQKTHQEGFI
ncbi:hypothetical protein MNB_SUP05-SYMBIONT-5-341 [hydrothermal vent metagenome]|uniref:Uncharacterized protein n=1 Tax=hydrothermal vent metagenome TaxID=652676 RepID=A0A1W1E1R9_9ZZZZ